MIASHMILDEEVVYDDDISRLGAPPVLNLIRSWKCQGGDAPAGLYSVQQRGFASIATMIYF